MYVVVIKFVEVFTRAAFVVGLTYSFDLATAGQFGVTVTLIGLFAFAFNWERHVDLQRRYVDQPPDVFDRAIKAALPFWGVNQAVMLPVFLIVAALMARLGPVQLALAAVIVACEQIGNQTYQMALVSSRYRGFLGIVAGKNLGILAAVAPWMALAPARLTLDYALAVWALGQVLSTVFIAVLWLRRNRAGVLADDRAWHRRILDQHRASLTHFTIGIVAILMLQADRLIAGTLLPLADTGIYFRHVLIVSFTYQFFNVASFNRIMPRVFAAARTEPDQVLARMVVRELAMVWAVVIGGFAAACVTDAAFGGAIFAHYRISVALAAVLLTGALIRTAADCAGLICNARMQERALFRRQLAGFAVGGTLSMGLGASFGMMGIAAGNVAGSMLYLALIVRLLKRRHDRPPPSAAMDRRSSLETGQ